MSTCLTCGDRTEDNAEFCSGICFYQMEAELDMPLAGVSVNEMIIEAAEAETRKAADGGS